MQIAVGVDSHKRTLAAAAVDFRGIVCSVKEFGNDPAGHKALLAWTASFDDVVVGIEGSGNLGAAVSRHLLAAGLDVREVPANRTFTERKRTPGRGKSDAEDSIAIARAVVQDSDLPSARRSVIADELKVLVTHHEQLSRLRTQLINRIHKLMVVIRPGYQDKIARLTSAKGLSAVVAMLRRDHSVQAEIVRDHVSEVRRLERRIAAFKAQIEDKVSASGTTLVGLQGVGPFVAAKVLGEIGAITKIRSKASFARLNATAPIPASSGASHRHRLNPGGNRQLNHALHVVAINRLRCHPESQAYVQRKQAEGKSKEAIRCLKRQLSNVIYRQLLSDLSPGGAT